MTPYYEDAKAGITIYHADCRDVLPTLKPGAVDLVLTDPPYGISQECNLTTSGIQGYGGVNFGDWDDAFPFWALPLMSALRASSYYCFCPYQALSGLADWAKGNGLLQRVLWWKKTNPTRRNGNAYWSIPGEHIFFAKAPGASFYAAHEVGYFEYPNVQLEGHPTAKPLPLLRRLITASSSQGESVLDPFMGSGTTLRAAKDLGRRAIGIEIEERYCEIAVKRLQQEVIQFGEPHRVTALPVPLDLAAAQ